MTKNLVIVESPAKAKTIEKILGEDYTVKSSFGHICDLPKKGLGIDIDKDFKPQYEVMPDKKAVVAELTKMTKEAGQVWLASDEDREGEAIAWHLSEILKLDPQSSNRIVFHEITSSAIKNAIANPRAINIELVNAQQARRVLDRLVGFELSPVLWRKVKPSLSAGRVQSVAVRLIVDREREIISFVPERYWRVTAIFLANGKEQVRTELSKRFETKEEAYAFLMSCRDFAFKVGAVEQKKGIRSPFAPFTTSTLQQEASRRLSFSVSQTMRIAQGLYEAGLITYMRTDSVNLSKEAVAAINKVVTGRFGQEYLKNRSYYTNSKGAQEAHEAIRPTYMDRDAISGSRAEMRLYDLIWRRAVASQMSDAVIERTTVQIETPSKGINFVAKGEVVIFPGFLKVYDTNDKDVILPPLKKGDDLGVSEMEAQERFEQKPTRYSEATLVRHLEELGIGRPSTYAPTISTIVNRGYVVKEDRDGVKRDYEALVLRRGNVDEEVRSEVVGAEKAKLFPTDVGMIVTDYLQKHFPAILDYDFTANVEKQFDDIAQGELSWNKMIKEFYAPFHATVYEAMHEEQGFASSEVHNLGKDPKTGKTVYARMGRFGPVVQLGETDDKPQYASLEKNMLLETVTLEEALDLLKMPRDLGEYEGKKISVGIGRFGPYILHNSKFTSITKEYDPYKIDRAQAIALVEEKRLRDSQKVLRTFGEDPKLQIHNGRFGVYIYYDGGNYKADKGVRDKLVEMPYDEVMAIVKAAPEPRKKFVKPALKTVKTAKATKPKKTAPKKS